MTGIIEVDGKDAELSSLLFELVDLRLGNKRFRAAMAIADKRLLDATNRINATPAGCDTAEWLADKIIELRARVGEIEARYDNVTISLKEKCAELKTCEENLCVIDAILSRQIDRNAELRAELITIKLERRSEET